MSLAAKRVQLLLGPLGRLGLLGLLAAGAVGSAAAAPIDFHPGEELAPLRLFAHDGDLLVVWARDHLSIVDSESLETADLDLASGQLAPLPVPGGEAFFYTRIGTAADRLMALRGRQKIALTERMDPIAWAAAGGNLFFTTWQPGIDVWASDGSPAGTGLLFDSHPGWVSSCPFPCPPFNNPIRLHAAANGRLYSISQVDDRTELWTRDPAAEFPGLPPSPRPASRKLLDIDQDWRSLVMPDGRLFLFFFGAQIATARPSLWITDGSAAGLRQLAGFPVIQDLYRFPALYLPVELNGGIYFLAEAAGSRQLWRSDGTAAGTALVREFGTGLPIGALFSGGGRLYLPVDAEGLGEELWTSDGTAEGTRLVADVRPGPFGAKPRDFAALPDGRIAVSLDDGVHGAEPYVSDGTAAGTRLLADALPGPRGSEPSEFVHLGGRLFFAAQSAEGRRTPSFAELEPLAPPPACPSDRLCLRGGRFEVEASWTAQGETGRGRRARASDEAGLFTFFSPDNWEVMVKVLDGCAINDRFWVFAAAATDVQYQLKVTDTLTSIVEVYAFGGGSPAPATTDVDAFATCP